MPVLQHEDFDEPEGVSRDERVRRALTAGRVCVWHSDPPFDKLVFDLGDAERIGLPTGDRLDLETLYACAHPDDRSLLRRAFARCLESDSDCDVEFRMIQPRDGCVRRIQMTGRRFADTAGRALRLDGILQEVTAKRPQELERLHRTEERLSWAV